MLKPLPQDGRTKTPDSEPRMTEAAPSQDRNIFIDVSTIHHMRGHSPVGISRVEGELVKAILELDAKVFQFCRFDRELNTYLPVTRYLAEELSGGASEHIRLFSEPKSSALLPAPHASETGADGQKATGRWFEGHVDDGWITLSASFFVAGADSISLNLYLPELDSDARKTKLIAVVVDDGEPNVFEAERGVLCGTPKIAVRSKPGSVVHLISQYPEPVTDADPRSLGFVVNAVLADGSPVPGLSRSQDSGADIELTEGCFLEDSKVVVAGLPWDTSAVRWLYRRHRDLRISVDAIIYDIVPMVMPEYCVAGMTEKFGQFILDAAHLCDSFYCISDSTKSAVGSFLEEARAPIPNLRQIRLGETISLSTERRAPGGALSDLKPGKFVLYVSTIEARKNHDLLFRIWRKMLDEAPDKLLPIVFVGQLGWRTQNLIESINLCYRLTPEFIRFAHGVSDGTLGWLYKNSRYTVYPSRYEGWGLPVAESLALGTPCLAADSSSLPEVSQGLVDLIDPDDFTRWYDAVSSYNTDDGLIERKRKAVREKFKPFQWDRCFAEMITNLLGGPAAEALNSGTARPGQPT